jgi:phospholipid/cholesterol/gamma-HCH transport system substrate-binding protein
MGQNIWDKNRSLSYVKVGVFFIFGFILLFFTLVSMKDFTFFRGTYTFEVEFEFAEGLRTSAPVRFCGVDVGEVKKVTIKESDGRPIVHVYASADKTIRIPKNSFFIINSLSLFGEKYLEITPPEEVKGYVNPGDTVEGLSPIPLFSIFSSFTQTMQEISAFINEGELKGSLENSLANIESITMNLNSIIEDTKDSRGTIGRLLYDDSIYRATEEFILDIKAHPWKLLNKPKERRR